LFEQAAAAQAGGRGVVEDQPALLVVVAALAPLQGWLLDSLVVLPLATWTSCAITHNSSN
jgi:hypothetical protein